MSDLSREAVEFAACTCGKGAAVIVEIAVGKERCRAITKIGWGEYWNCILPKGHEGSHKACPCLADIEFGITDFTWKAETTDEQKVEG